LEKSLGPWEEASVSFLEVEDMFEDCCWLRASLELYILATWVAKWSAFLRVMSLVSFAMWRFPN